MKVCVIGCGAIGSIYAAHLAQENGVEVWGVDTDQAHVDAINRNGLKLIGVCEQTVRFKATSDIATIPSCDFTIVATKSNQTRNAMQGTARVVERGIVCSFQNGFGNEDILADFAPDVVSATVMVGGHVCEPGVVEYDSRGITWLGRASGRIEMSHLQTLADVLSTSGLESIVVNDPRSPKWTKLIFNAAANPLCALTRLSYGQMYQTHTLRNLMYTLVDEGVAVASALDIDLEQSPRVLLDRAAETASSHVPSMLADVFGERPTEIDLINGHIVRQGKKLNVPCPLNESVVALVRGLESSWQ